MIKQLSIEKEDETKIINKIVKKVECKIKNVDIVYIKYIVMPVRRRRGITTPSGPNDEDDVDSLTQGMGDVRLGTEGKTDTREWRAKLPDSVTVPVAQPVRTGEGFHQFSIGKQTTFYNPNEGKD